MCMLMLHSLPMNNTRAFLWGILDGLFLLKKVKSFAFSERIPSSYLGILKLLVEKPFVMTNQSEFGFIPYYSMSYDHQHMLF